MKRLQQLLMDTGYFERPSHAADVSDAIMPIKPGDTVWALLYYGTSEESIEPAVVVEVGTRGVYVSEFVTPEPDEPGMLLRWDELNELWATSREGLKNDQSNV